jgi:hypothetical protein
MWSSEPTIKNEAYPKSQMSREFKYNLMINKLKKLFAKKTIVATANKIKSGYSHGASDGSSSGQWRKA